MRELTEVLLWSPGVRKSLCLPTCLTVYGNSCGKDPQSRVDWRGLSGDGRTRREENGPEGGSGKGMCVNRGRQVGDLVWLVRNQQEEAGLLSSERVSKAQALEVLACFDGMT